MNLFSWWWSSTFFLSFTPLLLAVEGTTTTFTLVNRCNYTVWPVIDAEAFNTGFELPRESSRSFQLPAGCSGRLWARTGCKHDLTGVWSCLTGDCGTGLVECSGAASPSKPVTLAEFTLGDSDGVNFYDVSLVDGFNVPMNLEVVGGSGPCNPAGCNVELNILCPVELAFKDGTGCMDPCGALGNSEYCCHVPLPSMCRPNLYSELFKAACPRSYSYAFDDQATYVCTGGDFVLTFCPSSSFFSS